MVIKIRNPEDGSVSRIECTEIRYCLNPGTVMDGIPEKYHAVIEMNGGRGIYIDGDNSYAYWILLPAGECPDMTSNDFTKYDVISWQPFGDEEDEPEDSNDEDGADTDDATEDDAGQTGYSERLSSHLQIHDDHDDGGSGNDDVPLWPLLIFLVPVCLVCGFVAAFLGY